MAASVVISFKDIDVSERVRGLVEDRCNALAEEFPETTHFEVTLSPNGAGHSAHGHVTGRDTDLAVHGEAEQLGHAADKLLDTLEKRLRKIHDKKIFSRRRASQREAKKRREG